MQGSMIKKRTHLRLLASLGGEVEMLFGAGEIPGKAEKFEQKGAALDILGVVAHFGAKCLNGFVEVTVPLDASCAKYSYVTLLKFKVMESISWSIPCEPLQLKLDTRQCSRVILRKS